MAKSSSSNTVVIGKHKGHVVTGELVVNGGKKPGLKITAWDIDEKPAAQKYAKELVGKTFETVGKAGVVVYEITNKHFGTPENLKGRWIVFKEEGASVPTVRREAKPKAEKPAKVKAEKAATAPRSERQAKNDAVAAAEKTVKKASKVTTRKARMIIERYKDQTEVASGKTRFLCNACLEAFEAKVKSGETPAKCPKGHKQAAIEADVRGDNNRKPAAAEPDDELAELSA